MSVDKFGRATTEGSHSINRLMQINLPFTVSGNGNIHFQDVQLTHIKDPTNETDAVNKQYLENQLKIIADAFSKLKKKLKDELGIVVTQISKEIALMKSDIEQKIIVKNNQLEQLKHTISSSSEQLYHELALIKTNMDVIKEDATKSKADFTGKLNLIEEEQRKMVDVRENFTKIGSEIYLDMHKVIEEVKGIENSLRESFQSLETEVKRLQSQVEPKISNKKSKIDRKTRNPNSTTE